MSTATKSQVTKPTKPIGVTITLAKVHTRAGVEYSKGAQITIRQDEIKWFRQRGLIDKMASAAPARTE